MLIYHISEWVRGPCLTKQKLVFFPSCGGRQNVSNRLRYQTFEKKKEEDELAIAISRVELSKNNHENGLTKHIFDGGGKQLGVTIPKGLMSSETSVFEEV